jgi:ATP/maltotriose-dependent transcriptional regulator MalT
MLTLGFLGDSYFDQGKYAEGRTCHHEAVQISKSESLPSFAAVYLSSLGLSMATLGQYAEAEGRCREALQLFDPVRLNRIIPALIGVAYITGKCGDVARGVRWLIFALDALANSKVDTDRLRPRAIGKMYLAELRAELTEDEYAVAQEQAKSLELEPLVAEILASPPLFAGVLAEGQAMNTQHGTDGALSTKAMAHQATQPQSATNQTLTEPLSKRELEVLRLVADGLSNAEIAQKLFLTVGTVKVHTRSIYGKLGVNSRTQAVALAQKLSLV